MGAYGTIQQCKVMASQPGRKAAAMIRFATVDDATWIVENVNGNIPQGLTEAIEVKYAQARDQGKGDGGKGFKGGAGGPYDMGKGGGKPKGKGKGWCDIRTLVKGLQESGALPGGAYSGNDENTLFVANLPWDTTDCDLYRMFSPFGAIKSTRAMLDPVTGVCKGIGFVNCVDAGTAQMSIAALSGTQLPDGTQLNVSVKTEGGKGKGKMMK